MFFQSHNLIKCFRHRRDQNGGNSSSSPERNSTVKETVAEEEAVLCRMCLAAITNKSEITAVNGSHGHTFSNPDGIVFDIGCFKTADGCSQIGPASAEFTWFKGYLWQVAVCNKCIRHIGWKFAAMGRTGFYGLITDRLIYPAGSSS